MSSADATIKGLREALQVSPENIPLRMHLAQTLVNFGFLAEAEIEYREVLKLNPRNADAGLLLVDVYLKLGKSSQAMVVIEDICSKPNPPAAAFVAYAKLLNDCGDARGAVAQYKRGIELDPAVSDPELDEEFGFGESFEQSDVFEGRVRQSNQSDDRQEDIEIERPKIKFEDVGGMEATKEEISIKILYPLQHPEMYAAYGKQIGGGILMYGAPGCGKTYLARATAGEIGAGFISVGISDVLDMWIGQSERNLSALFDHARRNTPCVLFFDEVDALGGKRRDMSGGAGRQVINQFLSEMDGVDKSNEGVLVLAATNAPWHVDPAFRRPGRFDRVLFVPPPDEAGLASVLQIQLKGKPQNSINFSKVAKKLKGFSGADVKAVVDQAIELKLREAMKTGVPSPIATNDLLKAAKSLNPTTQEWFSTAKNYAIYSNQGGVYDEVLKYLKL